jgi:predicted outer membrane repeat protein
MSIDFFNNIDLLTKFSHFGGNMQRFFRMSFLAVLLCIFFGQEGYAQLPTAYVSGSIAPGEVRVFQRDSIYIINKKLVVGGTLIIEPGTTVKFLDNGCLIDSTGGRIIADGFARITYDQTAVPDPVSTYPATAGGFGYADMRYFFYNDGNKSTLSVNTRRDPTVHPSKYNHIFNVVIDTVARKIVNLDPNNLPTDPRYVIVPFEYAIAFQAARLYMNPESDPNLKTSAWKRHLGGAVPYTQQRIRFIGQPVNNFSREWGHIVVLPGARAAFFRNVVFEGFKKDTTVDRLPYYAQNDLPGLNTFEYNSLMNKLRNLANGAGGAITTFSSRTWLLNVTFTDNIARLRGGALQILQAPEGYPVYNAPTSYYPDGKNPQVTNRDGSISEINSAYKIPLIDNIDDAGAEPLLDRERMAWDDARIAVYLGRIRNVKFDRNKVILAKVGQKVLNTVPPVVLVTELTDVPADYPYSYGNKAFGGALYIAGNEADENRRIEIALGLNDKLVIGGTEVELDPICKDALEVTNNEAHNYQDHMSSFGARGGAIYVGANTSVIFSGKFENNQTKAPFLVSANNAESGNGFFSMGGAIFAENSLNRIQIRGGQRDELKVRSNVDVASTISNPTHFINNQAGAGGAIYVDGNVYNLVSPVIGGSDFTWNTRDYGFDVKFINNYASSFGGAIYSKRNTIVTGAGGVQGGLQFYGGNYPILFQNNKAGYYGGAIALNIPNNVGMDPFKRLVQIVRANFDGNVVGENVADVNKPDIRGGGAIYSLNGDLNLVKGSLFINNKVYNGNGGAIALANPLTSLHKIFVTDLDIVHYDMYDSKDGFAIGYTSVNEPFTYSNAPIVPDVRMLTRFLDNTIVLDDEIINTQMGSGTTQIGHGTPLPSDHINATYWIDNKNGYAVGNNGMIVKFSNGGAKWDFMPSNTNVDLTDIYFTTDDIGYAVGAYTTILKTTNKGQTWTKLTVPSINNDPQINDINFVGTEVGYAVANEGYILKTTNAGVNWTVTRPATRDLKAIAWVGVNKGYVVGERGLILTTTNGGANWDVQIMPGLTSDLNYIMFKSAAVGFAAGKAGVIIKTNDGGNTWDFVNSGTDQELKSIFFYGQNTGYAVGASGTIVKTTDGGNNWVALTSGTTNTLNSVYFVNNNEGFVSGNVGLLLATKDAGATWTQVTPADMALIDVKRWHKEAGLPENGVGLGGAIYILDKATLDRTNRIDSVLFNRVRIQNNVAFTGSAIYSDNYDLKLIFNRSLVTGNKTDDRNTIGLNQNYISGPAIKDASGKITGNFASSDLAPATIYGEVQGPLPSYIFSEAANSFYGNTARFMIRLPDAPNTKGVLAGTTGIGMGGTDTLRGNYWGHTEANVLLQIANNHGSPELANMETFFVNVAPANKYDVQNADANYLPFSFAFTQDPRTQGPFESVGRYTYSPIPLQNGQDENTVGNNSIAEKYLMSGHIYDIYDKGTDIKTADYSKRRMTPIEDFAVGIAPKVKRYATPNTPSYNKYVKRYLRDPFAVEARDDQGNLKYPFLTQIQGEWKPDETGRYYHPIGYPLFLETMIDYNTGLVEQNNHDERMLNESVFFVINETTGDFIRVNFKQVGEDAARREIFRARVELVPDSSNRNANTSVRRTEESLLNLGSNGLFPFAPYSNPVLLQKLYRDAYSEDAAALQGRKYHADSSALAKVFDLFSNRPSMPETNRTYPGGIPRSNTTYFAGERYRALPVDTGDVVRIISRTVLWREGVSAAYYDGIVFKVTRSTMPPVFTGDLPRLAQDTVIKIVDSEFNPGQKDTLIITDFINKIFVTEDRTYPAPNGTYTNRGYDRGRDSILTVTAIDSNKFYDPRSLLHPDKYSNLLYNWLVDDNSALKRWLLVDTLAATYQKDNASGYFMFKGQPLNPYIVPGGEDLYLEVRNFPPHYRSVDVLKELNTPQDIIDQFVHIFPKYISNPIYDVTNARYLQQDTIDFASNYVTRQTVKIFVVDSAPRFLEPGAALGQAMVKINKNTSDFVIRDYTPTVYTCGKTATGKLKANLTNRLRFKVDFNTDDELEDSWALDWDFRYGKTSYGFMNVAMRGGDTPDTVVLQMKQLRPIWMSNQYMVKYDNPNVADPFGFDFLSKGQLHYSIDRTTALGLLARNPQYNGALVNDTVFAIVANDGHGGVTEKLLDIYINYAPEITTDALPDAIEGIDYNPTLMDEARMVKVFDANVGERFTYELAYDNYPVDSLDIDPCFPEAGKVYVERKTPKWLKINRESGALYGIPGLNDAPKNERVTVIVRDENGLPAVKTFDLKVLPSNHTPELSGVPAVECVDQGSPWETYITLKDLDLSRINSDEQITLTLVKPNDPTKLTITPSTVKGPIGKADTLIRVWTNNFNLQRDPDGKVTVRIEARDKAGKVAVLEFRLQLSLPTDFLVPLTIQNAIGAKQTLVFGTAPNGATTGDATDGNDVGTIDYDLCEFEIPPYPPNDVFDARWSIPTRNGVHRNIYPRALTGQSGERIYRGRFQAGGERTTGSGSLLYPVTITWPKSALPAKNSPVNPTGASWYIRDAYSNGNLFSVDMRTGAVRNSQSVNVESSLPNDPDLARITILSDAIDAFIIVYDMATDVEGNNAITDTRINNVSPNPVRSATNINFSVANTTNITMEVFDNLGNKVATIINAPYNAGTYNIEWNAVDVKGSLLPSGTYNIRLVAGESVSVFPVVVVR